MTEKPVSFRYTRGDGGGDDFSTAGLGDEKKPGIPGNRHKKRLDSVYLLW